MKRPSRITIALSAAMLAAAQFAWAGQALDRSPILTFP